MKGLKIFGLIITCILSMCSLKAQTEISINTKGEYIILDLKKNKKTFSGIYISWDEAQKDAKLQSFLKQEFKMDIFKIKKEGIDFHFKNSKGKCKKD